MPSIIDLFSSLPPAVTVVIVSMLPIIELRGAIPLGLLLGMSPWEAIGWATLGNVLIVPPALLGLYAARRWARDWPIVRPLLDFVEKRVEQRRATVDRIGPWGLLLFVGIPIPGTGAWSAAAIATVIRLPWAAASAAIIAGVLLAAALVGALSALGWAVLQ